MQSVIPPGDPERTVIAGQKQGWRGLAINFSVVEDADFPGQQFPAMTTAWEPTTDELVALLNGAKIIVQILGNPPINPMVLYVGECPPDDR